MDKRNSTISLSVMWMQVENMCVSRQSITPIANNSMPENSFRSETFVAISLLFMYKSKYSDPDLTDQATKEVPLRFGFVVEANLNQ
jgi:hypothetical protein